MGVNFFDDLTIERDDKVKHAVSGGMLGPDIDHEIPHAFCIQVIDGISLYDLGFPEHFLL
jgi:hypothetical protein